MTVRFALAAAASCCFLVGCPAAEEEGEGEGDEGEGEVPGDVVDEACDGSGVAVGYPLPPGTYTIGQGNNGAFSHFDENEFAYDFTVAKGTDVIAARGGTVVVVVDEFGDGAPDAALANEANFVIVDHGAGTFDSYFHLDRGGMAVSVGDNVAKGDVLGTSGNSGFSSGPHLHFAVVDALLFSVPSCFAPGDVVPDTADDVTAVASPLVEPDVFPRGLLPDDAFADANVVIDNDVTAYDIDGSVHVEGHVTDGNHRAALLLAPIGGGDLLAQVIVNVDDAGAFAADLDCSAFVGLRGFGVSSVDDATGNFAVAVLAPMTVR